VQALAVHGGEAMAPDLSLVDEKMHLAQTVQVKDMCILVGMLVGHVQSLVSMETDAGRAGEMEVVQQDEILELRVIHRHHIGHCRAV
jgi:hypothetical protein